MKEKNVIDVEYRIFDQRAECLYTIRVSPDADGLTEIVQKESDGSECQISLFDEDLPLFIEALQRRLNDVSKKEPA